MRPHGKTKLGFFPLPLPEAQHLRNCLTFAYEFSALDPCVGDGVAFTRLLQGTCARCYGIEIDANRVEQARSLGIEVLQADALEVRCPTEVLSLLYLNPPYDFETGQTNNQRLEFVFLEHTYRWLKPGGVLVLVIPQPQLRVCARILSEHFTDLSVYRLTDPASVQYKQVAVLGVRRKRHQHLRDSALLDSVRWLEMLASKTDLESLGEASGMRYEVPDSGPVTLTHVGIPLDEVEDLLPDSAAYRQASRILLPKQRHVRGRPRSSLVHRCTTSRSLRYLKHGSIRLCGWGKRSATNQTARKAFSEEKRLSSSPPAGLPTKRAPREKLSIFKNPTCGTFWVLLD